MRESLHEIRGGIRGEVVCEIAPERLIEVCARLRDDPDLGFEQLIDVCAVDYAAYGQADWETSETATFFPSRGTGGFA